MLRKFLEIDPSGTWISYHFLCAILPTYSICCSRVEDVIVVFLHATIFALLCMIVPPFIISLKVASLLFTNKSDFTALVSGGQLQEVSVKSHINNNILYVSIKSLRNNQNVCTRALPLSVNPWNQLKSMESIEIHEISRNLWNLWEQ